MRSKQIYLGVATAMAAALAGCSSNGTSTSTSPTSTDVVYTFEGQQPSAVAVQIGAEAYTSTSLQSGKLSISVPNGTTNYAIAYACPQAAGLGATITAEYVIEASLSDGNTFTASCNEAAGTTGSATGSVNASGISGVASVLIRGNAGYGGSVASANGSFNVSMLTGSNDVAFIAEDSLGNVKAVQILRAQTVPGSINSGNTVTFHGSDQVTMQNMTVANVPSGFATPPAASVEYVTADGTQFLLSNNSLTQYPLVPAAYVQSGDFYSFEASASDTATHSSAVGNTQNSSGGGAVTLSLPTPWTYSGPSPAVLPTFNFSYSGYSDMSAVAQQAEIEWEPSTNVIYTLTVTATANYQGSGNSIVIPNLSSVSGFFGSASAGSAVYWVADIWGGTTPVFDFLSAPPSSGSISFVQQSGTFVQP